MFGTYTSDASVMHTLAAGSVDTDKAVSVIKSAVDKANSVPAPLVLDAMLQLEAQKLSVSSVYAV